MKRAVITLLTDFGLDDHFVGVMKGVILGICPGAAVIDITHELPSQAIGEAAFILGCAYPYFPPGSVHVVVVDPGVGTKRRPLAARCGDHFFVGPDNGVMSYAFADDREPQVVEITNPECRLPQVSATFHGRDVFAPAAAHLAAGTALESLGGTVERPVRLHLPAPRQTSRGLEAHVLHVDRFGNLITDLTQQHLSQWLAEEDARGVVIEAGHTSLRGIRSAYESVPRGRALALIGSAGRLEIAVNGGRASHVLGLDQGDTILLRKPE